MKELSIEDKRILNEEVWALDPTSVLEALDSSSQGLQEEIAMQRAKRFGPNVFGRRESLNIFSIFLKQFKSPLIFILLAATILTLILREWVDATVILLAVLVNTALGFYQEFRAEQTLQKLTLYIKERARVIRDSSEHEVEASSLVPGDIIHIAYGSRVPADARLLSVNALLADESILTGESLPIKKNVESVSRESQLADRINMIFAGTLITEGYATAVVSRTGEHTELGRIAMLVSGTKRPPTPLQVALKKFGWIIFGCVLIIVTGIFVLGILRGEPVLGMILLSAAVSVGAIPEALPIALTMILAIGVERLAARKGIMRSLAAAETLGSASVIMTDKTGTLTEADMKLVGLLSRETILRGDSSVENIGDELTDEQMELLLAALSNIDVVEEKPATESETPRFLGRPIEVNIARLAYGQGLRPNKKEGGLILPFSSSYKFSVARNGARHELVALGAPDILLARSTMAEEDRVVINRYIDTVSAEGKRLLGLASFGAAKDKPKTLLPDDVKGLHFLGLIALHDPIRKEVPSAIRHIESSGVKVVMVTGDIQGTALAVARSLGWEVTESQAMSGSEIRALSDEELLKRLPHIKIFARVTPEDKLRIGALYQGQGYVVAMTGDGVNDAPSLKAMDIGIALGSGSDVAKSAADLVLFDDNFRTIVSAIDEGKRILSNIRKAFVYLMSNSLDEVILIGGSLAAGLALPLSALQIIWVNLFTGSLPALSFAFDENYDETIGAKKAKASIFNKEVTILTAGIGVLTSIGLFFLYITLLHFGFAFKDAQSILFACFASYILAVAFSFRSLRKPISSYPFFSNSVLNGSVLLASIVLIATLSFDPLRSILDLAPLPRAALWILPLWLLGNIVLVELSKWAIARLHGAKKSPIRQK